MKHVWWSHEDYRANKYHILTSDEVYNHFYKQLSVYDDIEENDNNYVEPKILSDIQGFAIENFSQDSFYNVIQRWNKNFTKMGINISKTDIMPLIKDLKFNECRQLIIEKPQGFIQFTTYSHKNRKHFLRQCIRFEYLPKLGAC